MEDFQMVARAHQPIETSRSHERIVSLAKQIRNQWTPEQREFRARLAKEKVARLAPFLFDQISQTERADKETIACGS
jgi:hypothetical protein